MSRERFEGCLLGLALGDALGAPFEGGVTERILWRFIGKTRRGEIRWTDDTQMSIDVIESILAQGSIDADHLASRFAKSYRWNRGYGPAAAKLLRRIARGEDWRTANRRTYRSGSFGNGAAMRAPIVGLYCSNRLSELVDMAQLSASVTHAHPVGIEGAVAVSYATALAVRDLSSRDILKEVAARCTSDSFTSRLSVAKLWIENGFDPSVKEVVRHFGNGVAAAESCVTAIFLALRYREQSFENMQHVIATCRGDVDTIGAMAGAIWGAANGVEMLPAKSLARLEQRDRLMTLAANLHQAVQNAMQDEIPSVRHGT
jgi:poly(ADP-ribose) glycohydrolase ARH3